MSSTQHIQSIFKSRKNLLEILESRGYDITPYSNFSINEINILLETNQLDMLVENSENSKKIYVKYYINKVIKPQNMYEIVEDLHHLENILTKNDDLIIIIKDEPNDTLIQNVKDIWEMDGIYISLLNIKRLQFNVLKHSLQPTFRVLSKKEENEFKRKYNVLDNSQIPDISYFSPVSLVLGIRPNNIVEITRDSRTAISAPFYRVCKI